ncbi:hypothetical protein H5410_001779 [Solanum commersonii]|uniref:Uncharacterized protein n=1 Tax=Solanum commersonii TaxID=4109 RepID=A0A9J6B001_SOLCO|nr:hypothetical protein H5410_001779 [Solanum commersonii]
MTEEPNRWLVVGQWKIYRDAKMLNEKEKMARMITKERRVLTGSSHIIPNIHWLFQLHKYDWMAKSPGLIARRLCGNSMPLMLPLSAGLSTRGPIPQPRTLSFLF